MVDIRGLLPRQKKNKENIVFLPEVMYLLTRKADSFWGENTRLVDASNWGGPHSKVSVRWARPGTFF